MVQKFLITSIILNLCSNGFATGTVKSKPHIIIILADDLGWNDVGFHGSNQIPTPNIDALAYNGIILNNHYTGVVGTSSRVALLTGKYPIRLGMQHLDIQPTEARGLNLSETLLPQYLKEEGYATHIVGKWHLGYCREKYTPTFRGFNSHFGFWMGHQDYYTHTFVAPNGYSGYDMRHNMSIPLDTKNRYSTDLYTEETVRLIDNHNRDTPMFIYLAHAAVHSANPEDPLQAPDAEIAKFSDISDPDRRKYAAMVSRLDQSVGDVVAALRNRKMLNNSIILFMSDNGAATRGPDRNSGSNYPLRGTKATAWEGAVRSVAAIWSPLLRKTQRVSDQLMHMSDWLPTLLYAAGINITLPEVDGLNMWSALSDNERNPRREVLINIDATSNYSAIRSGDYKYLVGNIGMHSGWYGDLSESNGTTVDYNSGNVLTSKTGAAIIGLMTNIGGSNSSTHFDVLTSSKIDRLRAEATLHCNVQDDEKVACDLAVAPCLFNLTEDPCEMINIISLEPEVAEILGNALEHYQNMSLPVAGVKTYKSGDPANWKLRGMSIWTNWLDNHPAMSAAFNDERPSTTTAIIALLGCSLIFAVSLIIILLIKNRQEKRGGQKDDTKSTGFGSSY